MKRVLPLVTLVLVLVAPAQAFAALPGDSPAHGPTGAAPQISALDSIRLRGYQQVISGPYAAEAEAEADANCPRGSRPVGGGALFAGSSRQERLVESDPANSRWSVRVLNSGAVDGTYQVYAICVKRTSTFAEVYGPNVDNPAGEQTRATVSCPAGTVPYGGGGGGYISTLTTPKLNSSLPLATGWRVNVNNDSGWDNAISASVVCGPTPLHYAQEVGTPVTVAPMSQASAAVSCPVGTVVFGGGGLSSGRSVSVDMHSSAPTGSSGWQVSENNNSTRSNTITAYAVCGKAG